MYTAVCRSISKYVFFLYLVELQHIHKKIVVVAIYTLKCKLKHKYPFQYLNLKILCMYICHYINLWTRSFVL